MTTQPFLPSGLEEQEPDAAFLSGLRRLLGFEPRTSIFGRAAQRRAPEFGSTFRFNELLNPFTPTAGQPTRSNPFESFVGNTPLSGLRGQASNLFGQLAGGTTGTAPAVREQFRQPTEEQASDLGNLAQTALSNRISPLALRLLQLPSGNDLRTQFLADQPADQDFINFLRSRIGFGLI